MKWGCAVLLGFPALIGMVVGGMMSVTLYAGDDTAKAGPAILLIGLVCGALSVFLWIDGERDLRGN